MLRSWDGSEGHALIDGFVLYDRYLWLDDEPPPARAQVVERASLMQAYTTSPTRHPSVRSVNPYGQLSLNTAPQVPNGFMNQWRCVRISWVTRTDCSGR
jgi:hypothetical protein